MRFISSNVEPTGACATVGDLATPMSMMPGTSVNEPRGGEGAAREVDGERAPEVKVALAFRACEVEGERPSLGRVQRRQALGQLLGHKRLHVRLPSGPRRTPRIFAPRGDFLPPCTRSIRGTQRTEGGAWGNQQPRGEVHHLRGRKQRPLNIQGRRSTLRLDTSLWKGPCAMVQPSISQHRSPKVARMRSFCSVGETARWARSSQKGSSDAARPR